MPRISYVQGSYIPHHEAAVHIEDRGFQFADSVYEVVALMDGVMADEKGHLDRLERSLKELKITMPMPRRSLQMVMRELVRRNRLRNGMIYIQVSRGQAPRDFAFPKNTPPTLVMTAKHASFDRAIRKNAGRAVITVPDIRWKRCDVKTTGLLAQVLAKQAALDAGAYDAWLVDEKGFITEAASSNAWIVDAKGNLITRPVAGNKILKGVTRSAIQDLCRKRKIKIIERSFTVEEAYKAKEAFTTAAVSMIVPIVSIDGKKIGSGKIGKLTSEIMDLYMDYAGDKNEKQKEWNPL